MTHSVKTLAALNAVLLAAVALLLGLLVAGKAEAAPGDPVQWALPGSEGRLPLTLS